tara:strand:+ start:65385 stop:65819 length:435 start_codon:yes stop_codon:yes gene_type:complete
MNRLEIIKTLETLRKNHCAYTGDRCDCKYGYDENSDGRGEVTGCPELREAIDLLNILDDQQYKAILSAPKATGEVIEQIFRTTLPDPFKEEKSQKEGGAIRFVIKSGFNTRDKKLQGIKTIRNYCNYSLVKAKNLWEDNFQIKK